jgi:hypothetical protein
MYKFDETSDAMSHVTRAIAVEILEDINMLMNTL